MKYFKGSLNKLGLLGFQSASRCRNPLFKWHKSFTTILIRIEVIIYPSRQALFTPFPVTTNKLEKILILD
jgi:hypothetical protein